MNSTYVKKHRKGVVLQRRTSSLSRSRSITALHRNSGNNKFRVTDLLKKNKCLAVALQDAQCKLSVKQKLLENASKHFNNILQVRVLMLEMQSDLKAVVRKFDDALSLLSVEDIKISDLISPFQSCGLFKSKIKKLADSVKGLSEENSFSIAAENANCDINVVNVKPPNHQNISSDKQATEMRNTIDVIRKEVENESTSKKTADAVNLRKPVEFCENVEAKVDSPVRMGSPEKNCALNDEEDSGTPRLSIPNFNVVKSTELTSCLKQCLFSKTSTPLKSVAKVLNTPISSVKISKIPKFQVSTLVKKPVSNETSTQPKICSQKNISEDSDLKTISRKTFFVKNSNISTNTPQSNDTLNNNDIQIESDFALGEPGQTSCRKTFVIKKLDLPVERKSITNRRKTFVKKSVNSNVRKSVRNKRDTFVISDNKEGTSNENVNSASERTFNNDSVKEQNLCSENKIVEELPLVCDKTSGITKNEFQENLSTKDILSNKQSDKILSGDEHILIETNNNVHKQEEFKLTNNSKNNNENLYELEVGDKKLPTSESVESSDICMMFEGCVQPVISDGDRIKVIQVKDSSKLKNAALPKCSFESSDSVCSTIPDLDFQFEKNLVKPVPIRKRVSQSKKKKVFVFNANKRKSVQNKKSLGIVLGTSAKLFNVVEECNDVSQSTSSTNIKNVKVASKLSECEDKENFKEHTSCTFASNIPDNEGNNSSIESSCSSKNVNKITLPESCKNIKKDSLLCSSSPVIAVHKLINTIECDNGGLDSGKEKDNICKLETWYKKENGKLDKKRKIKKCIAKNNDVDDISVKKVNRKQNSIKQSEQMAPSMLEQKNAYKRKSVKHKKSLGIVQRASAKLFNVVEDFNVFQSTSSTNIKNVKDATKLSECEDKENFKEKISYNFASNIPDNKSNSIQSPCSSVQEIIQCVATGGEDTENFKSIPSKNMNKIAMSESCKYVKKDSLSCLRSPVITSHKFINAIECDNKDLDSGKEQDNKICKSKTRYRKGNSRSDKKSKIKKSVAKNDNVDDISVKKVNRKQNSKQQSKQMVTSEVEQKNKELKNKNQEKGTKKKHQTRHITCKKDSLSNVPSNNILVVKAEVHSPPNSWDKEKYKSENCVVVLNDMFQSASIDKLSLQQENKTASKNKIISPNRKIPLSENSSNILISEGNHYVEMEGDIINSVTDTGRVKRRKNINYAEPSLRMKMRRKV